MKKKTELERTLLDIITDLDEQASAYSNSVYKYKNLLEGSDADMVISHNGDEASADTLFRGAQEQISNVLFTGYMSEMCEVKENLDAFHEELKNYKKITVTHNVV